MITAVLNGFLRPHTLKEQYEAIKAQTVTDVKIMFWGTMEDTSIDFPGEVIGACDSAVANRNHGTWGRFAFPLLTDTKYVCVIDDDTIPGKKWFENCLQTMETHRGVLSTRGVVMDAQYDREYPSPRSYKPVGWCDQNEETVRVDMGCHSWFFEKEWLRAYWAEMPQRLPVRWGEDTHISYAVKKHFGFNTYVPPHPKDDKDMWGSNFDKALEYGEDGHGISQSQQGNMGMHTYWNHVRDMGYKIIAEDQ